MLIPLGTLDIPTSGTGTAKVDLPETHYLKRLLVRVDCNISNSGAASLNVDALARFLSFRLFVGQAPLYDLRGDDLLHYFDHHHGIASNYSEVSATTGAQSGSWYFVIPLSDPRLWKPNATMVDLRMADNPRLEVTYNGAGAISAQTSIASGGTIVVTADVSVIPPDLEPVRILPLRRFRTVSITDLLASTADQQKKANKGTLIRAYMFRVVDQATPKAASDTIVDSIELVVNHQETGRLNWLDMREMTRNQYRISPASGVAFRSFDPGCSLDAATMLDLRGAREVVHQFATNAAGDSIDVRVTEEQIIPPDVAAQKAAVERLRTA